MHRRASKPSSEPGPFLGSLWALSSAALPWEWGAPSPSSLPSGPGGCCRNKLERPKYPPKNISDEEFQLLQEVLTECSSSTAFPSWQSHSLKYLPETQRGGRTLRNHQILGTGRADGN